MNEAVRPARNAELGSSNERFQNLHEFVRQARANLNQNAWDYIVGAAETETTMRRNRMALDEIAFRPRVLNDVAKVDASVERFGRKLRLPVMLAPVGALEIFDPAGAAAVVRGVGKFGAAHMLSSVSAPGLEEDRRGGSRRHALLPALCARRRRLRRGPCQPRHRGQLHRVLPDGRHRALLAPRARHRQALCPREPGALQRRRLPEGTELAHRQADQGQVQDPADHQGHRHMPRTR